jgi:hypothetical protein
MFGMNNGRIIGVENASNPRKSLWRQPYQFLTSMGVPGPRMLNVRCSVKRLLPGTTEKGTQVPAVK